MIYIKINIKGIIMKNRRIQFLSTHLIFTGFILMLIIPLILSCGETEQFGGIGIEVTSLSGNIVVSEKDLKIIKIFKGGAAENAGLAVGDRIIKIDNKPLMGKSFNQIFNMIRGKVGTKVSLTISRNDKISEYSLKRGLIELIK